jgi:hypothetical protein
MPIIDSSTRTGNAYKIVAILKTIWKKIKMKKLIPMLLLVGVSSNVFAEWTDVGNNDGGGSGGGITAYVDLGTIKRKGHKVKMWILYDFNIVQESSGSRYLSSTSRNEYDCEEETLRTLDYYWYSGYMKQGEIVVSVPNAKMEAQSVMPGSVGEILFKVACGKK